MCRSRGLGGSSAPRRLGAYTTEALAEDAVLLLDHLCWKVGHFRAAALVAEPTALQLMVTATLTTGP